MNVTATHNFFYNLNLTNIASLMYDRNQNLGLISWINFLPISSLPSPSTPVLDADFTCPTPSPSLNPAPSPAPPPAPSPSPNPAPSQLQAFVLTAINTNTTFILGNFGMAFHQGNLFFGGTNNWQGTGTLVISGNLVCNTTSHLTITPDLNFDIQGSSTFDGSLTMDIPPDETKNLDFFLSNPFKCNPCSGTFQNVGNTDPCFSTSETYTENYFFVLFGRSSSLCPSSVWPQVVVGVVGALFLIAMVVVGVMYFKSKKDRDRKMESFLLKARERTLRSTEK